MEVIEHGCFIHIAECENCGCKFNYNIREDVKNEYEMNEIGVETKVQYKYVFCPECMHRVKVGAIYTLSKTK